MHPTASSKWTCIYKIWGVTQQIVYETKTCDIGDLQKRLMQTWIDFEQNVIEAAIDQWRDHLRSWVHAVGGHFEHMLWNHCSLPAALRAAQTCRYLIYSEADFEVFRPAGATRCTDGCEIWHGGGHRRSPPPCQIAPPSVQRQGCRTPKIDIFTQIWPKCGI